MKMYWPIVVFFIFAVACLAIPGVWGSSEAREGQVIWKILHDGSWLLPLRNGLIPSKPPLFHWFAAIIGNIFGMQASEFLIRLPSLLAACGVLFVTGRLGGKVSPRVGTLAIAVLTLSYGFTRLAMDARVDMFFSFFVVAAVSLIVSPLVSQEAISRQRIIAFYLIVGLATLAKGPLGAALPILIGLSCVCHRNGLRQGLTLLVDPLGILTFLLIACPWYFAAANIGQEAFVSRQLVFENLQRFTGGEAVNRQPFWYYIPQVILGTAPWCFLVVLNRWKGQSSLTRQRLASLSAIWVLSGLILFSVASGKRASYLLPLYPGIALLIALSFEGILETVSAAAFLRARLIIDRIPLVIGAVMIGIALGIEALVPLLTARGLMVPLIPKGVALIIFLFGIASFVAWGGAWQANRRLVVSFSLLALLLITSIQIGLWVKAKLKGFDTAASRITELVGGEELTVLKGEREEFFDPLFYYLGREVSLRPAEKGSLECKGFAVLKKDEDFSIWGSCFRRLTCGGGLPDNSR